MEVQVSVMFDSRQGDLDPSATDRISTIGPRRARAEITDRPLVSAAIRNSKPA